jgi:uroporphyrinogen-III synthase
LKIFGEHTGNGESLSHFMLEHYGTWYETRSEKPPLLFAVGEQRRDIIPKTLMSSDLPPGRRIRVDELVVYGTGVMESFKRDLCQSLADTRASQMRWIVVFSPTGCDTMLAGLELLDETANGDSENMAKKEQSPTRARKTFVATIGPTTRDHLIRTFGFCPDVCAAEPSPQGIRTGILQFMKEWPVA